MRFIYAKIKEGGGGEIIYGAVLGFPHPIDRIILHAYAIYIINLKCNPCKPRFINQNYKYFDLIYIVGLNVLPVSPFTVHLADKYSCIIRHCSIELKANFFFL